MEGKLALVVEEDSIAAFCITKQLELLHVKTLAVLDHAPDIQKIIQFKKPDIIILNVNMKEQVDCLERIDNVYSIENIPVLLISNNRTKTAKFIAVKLTEKAMLDKPIYSKSPKKTMLTLND